MWSDVLKLKLSYWWSFVVCKLVIIYFPYMTPTLFEVYSFVFNKSNQMYHHTNRTKDNLFLCGLQYNLHFCKYSHMSCWLVSHNVLNTLQFVQLTFRIQNEGVPARFTRNIQDANRRQTLTVTIPTTSQDSSWEKPSSMQNSARLTRKTTPSGTTDKDTEMPEDCSHAPMSQFHGNHQPHH